MLEIGGRLVYSVHAKPYRTQMPGPLAMAVGHRYA